MTCDSKDRYRSQKRAENAMRRMNRQGLKAYFCATCKGWHLGHAGTPIDLLWRLIAK